MLVETAAALALLDTFGGPPMGGCGLRALPTDRQPRVALEGCELGLAVRVGAPRLEPVTGRAPLPIELAVLYVDRDADGVPDRLRGEETVIRSIEAERAEPALDLLDSPLAAPDPGAPWAVFDPVSEAGAARAFRPWLAAAEARPYGSSSVLVDATVLPFAASDGELPVRCHVRVRAIVPGGAVALLRLDGPGGESADVLLRADRPAGASAPTPFELPRYRSPWRDVDERAELAEIPLAHADAADVAAVLRELLDRPAGLGCARPRRLR